MTEGDEGHERGGTPTGMELLWGIRSRPRRGPKPTLGLDQIVASAIRIADAEGLAVLTMQRVASELGAGKMSLYRHVPGKTELVELMLDTVIGAPPAIDVSDWRRSLENWAYGNREVFLRHPWAFTIITTSRSIGPNETAWAEAALTGLTSTDLSPADAMDVLLLVNSYVRGAVGMSSGRSRGLSSGEPAYSPEVFAQVNWAERYPLLSAAMAATIDDPADDWGFSFGLRRVLDGISVLVATER